jgi:glutamate dehydrogenase (NAD(P)+)/glutamate dehydrogenase (NADP+)
MEAAWRRLGDELGPEQVVLVRDPRVGLEAFVVVDNTAAGPAIGGTRMRPTVTVDEVARLARAMTFKNAMARLPHGGAKSGIVADPAMPIEQKERLVRTFARRIAGITGYIPGPDMGTDERAMAWVHDEIGRAVGLPAVLGGIPLDVIGATGFGMAVCAGALAEAGRLPLEGARVVMHGYGAVGRHAAHFLAERGALLVGVADSRGAVASPVGINLAVLETHKAATGTVVGCPGTEPVSAAGLVALDCDLWAPASLKDVIDAGNAADLKARVVLPGANIAVTPEAEAVLHERGVLVLPDYVANAGGVICAAVEYHGGTEPGAFERITATIHANTLELLEGCAASGEPPRAVADRIARERVAEAAGYRRRC